MTATENFLPYARAAALGAVLVGWVIGCANAPTTNYVRPAGADDYVKAVGQIRAGNADAAIADLERALTVNPSLRMARMTLGEMYIARKDFQSAVPQLQAAIDLDPYTLRNHYNLGLSLQVLSRYQESAIAYLRGLKIAPDDFKTNMNLGLVYFALNQLDPAVYYLEKATRVEPNNARGWSNIGVVYDARGDLVFAEASYRKALELDPRGESTLINLTSNLIAQKKSADATAIARQLVAVAPSALSSKLLGDAFAAATQWSEASAAYDAATNIDVRFLPAYNAKAEMLINHYEADLRLDESLRQQALVVWANSLKIDANQPGVQANLARWKDAKVFN